MSWTPGEKRMTGEMSHEARLRKEDRARKLLATRGLTIETWTEVFRNIEATDWMLPFFWGVIIKAYRPVIGEIGVRGGTTTIAFLLAAQRADGHVYSVDIDPCETAIHNITAFNLHPRWTFTQADSKTYDFPEPLDFLFIDGDHSYQGVKADFEKHYDNVKKGGIICFHDAYNAAIPECGDFIKTTGAAILPIGKAGLGVLVK